MSVRGSTWLFIVLATCCLTSGCGGGGSSGGPIVPSAVEDVTLADLDEAGVPSVASLGGLSMMSLAGDWNGDGNVNSKDFIQSDNIDVLPGGGLAVNVPTADLGHRLVAWALYQLPVGADAHLAVLSSPFASSGNVRWFFAVANAGTGSWELGGRILAETITSQSWFTSSDPLPPGFTASFRRSLSMGQDYVLDDGNAYVLLMAGHPGTTAVNGYIDNTELWDWRTIKDSASDGFGSGLEGSYSWLLPGPGSAPDADRIFSYILGGDVHHQVHSVSNNGPNDVDRLMLFSQPFNPLIGAAPDQDLPPASAVTAADQDVWRFAYFTPGEMNGADHPFLLEREGDDAGRLDVVPLLHIPGAAAPNGIIGILIAATGPVPDAEISLLQGADEIVLKTGKAGEFVVPFQGTDTFTYTLVYDDGTTTPLSYELLVDPMAGTCHIE